jgi:uncharacterized cupredoxin-like copper-binding protein
MLVRKLFVTGLALVAFTSVACSNDDGGNGDEGGGGGGGGGATVSVTEKDFAIALDPSSENAGSVTFDIQNEGPSEHEFVVFKTDLEPDALPTKTDENGAVIVDEEGEGLESVDEQEDIQAGSSASLQVDLDAGSYVAICNLPGHYQQGMSVGFTVT